MAFPDVLLSIQVTVLPCARQCVFLAGMRRGTRRTQPPLWAHCCFWKHLGVLGFVGFTRGVPAPDKACSTVQLPLGLSCLLTSGHRGWSQTTWEKSHQASCSQIRQRRTQKQVFLELDPGQGETRQFQISGFKSEWFTLPRFRGFNLQL